MSNLDTRMAVVNIISCLAKNRPGHMETPPPINYQVQLAVIIPPGKKVKHNYQTG